LMKRQEITTALATRSPDELWAALLGHARTLQPFWAGGVAVFAGRTSLPDDKRNGYLGVISTAFDKMDEWRRGTAKYVKTRRNEIDSTISYLRNKAIETPNRQLRVAPAARNAASALRVCLTVSARGYNDAQLPELVAGTIYDVAAVRTLFPFDFGNLMVFHPGHGSTLEGDVLDVTIQHIGREFGILSAVNALVAEVQRLWENFDKPSPLVLTEGYWTADGGDADVQLRSAAIAAFHGKS
jgi:hypothetical protein